MPGHDLKQKPRVTVSVGRKFDYASYVVNAGVSIDDEGGGIMETLNHAFELAFQGLAQGIKKMEKEYNVKLE